MIFSSGILAGILALLAWGAADFIAKFALDRAGSLRTLFWVQALGMLALLPFALFFPVSIPTEPHVIILIIATGALSATAYFMFYRGFEKGKVSVVSPIAGCEAAVTVLLSLIFLGEFLSLLQGAGILLVLAGVPFVSFDPAKLKGRKNHFALGVPEALYSMFGWGAMFFLIGLASRSFDWFSLIIWMRLVAVILSAAALKLRRESFIPQSNGAREWKIFASAGALDSLALCAVAFAFKSNLVSIVMAVAGAYPAVTILLAFWFLREKLAVTQLIGIIAIICGIIAISA